ncbi:hypothetical protein D3C71_1463570 [compost metagenome]
MLLGLLQQQAQEFAGAVGITVVVSDQAAGERQGVADRGAVVDLQRDVQRLPGGAPGLFRLALQPEDARVDGQRRDALVVLHAEPMGETVEIPAMGHALQHLFGLLAGLMLIAGKMQGQHAQPVRAQGHHGVVMQP